MRQLRNPMRDTLIAFAVLALMTLMLLMLASALSGARMMVLLDPIEWLRSLDSAAAFDTLSNAAEVVAGVLAIAITVAAIVLELAANRYSHRITWLFVREPVNILVLSIFVLTTLQCVWVAATVSGSGSMSTDDAVLPAAGFAITLGMVTFSLLALLPYFNFVFAFLSPLNMIEKISGGALRRIRRVSSANLDQDQAEVEEAVDELQDVARSATEQGDRSIAMATVDALADLLEGYHELRGGLPEGWFAIGPHVASDADFVSMAPVALEDIERERLWLELKIMQQYLSLMSLSVPKARDVANLIAINTHRIATGVGLGRPELRALCLRCMNSYLRTTINAKDQRTTYFILNQYRLVAEAMLQAGEHDDAMAIANYLKFYGTLGYEMGMRFLLETAAHDLTLLIEADLAVEGGCTDELLELLLELDREIKDESQETSLLGVRRSQMQLATLFLVRGDQARAARIAEDLAEESARRLNLVQADLQDDHDPQYWEVTARGVNFSYLDAERRAQLAEVARLVVQARKDTG